MVAPKAQNTSKHRTLASYTGSDVCLWTVTHLQRVGLSVRRMSFRRRSTMTWTTACTTCRRLFMTLRRTAAMASLKQENNVTAATHLLRSDHLHHSSSSSSSSSSSLYVMPYNAIVDVNERPKAHKSLSPSGLSHRHIGSCISYLRNWVLPSYKVKSPTYWVRFLSFAGILYWPLRLLCFVTCRQNIPKRRLSLSDKIPQQLLYTPNLPQAFYS